MLLGTLFALAAAAQVRPPIGVAASDYPFLLQGQPVKHHGTLLEGEAVTSAFMPTRIRLDSGASYVLGIGSQLRVGGERVLLEGVSLEVVRSGARPQTILAAGLEIRAVDQATRGSIYTDRPEVLSVWASAGEFEVLDSAGDTVARVRAGTALTFSSTMSEGGPRVQEKRASLEIARILMRELQYLARVEEERPAIRDTRLRLMNRLAIASGGLLGDQAEEANRELEPDIPTGLPAVDPTALLNAAAEVERTLHQSRLDLAGCGDPSCATPDPPVARNDFAGVIGTLPPPYPGCNLCRGGELAGDSGP